VGKWGGGSSKHCNAPHYLSNLAAGTDVFSLYITWPMYSVYTWVRNANTHIPFTAIVQSTVGA